MGNPHTRGGGISKDEKELVALLHSITIHAVALNAVAINVSSRDATPEELVALLFIPLLFIPVLFIPLLFIPLLMVADAVDIDTSAGCVPVGRKKAERGKKEWPQC